MSQNHSIFNENKRVKTLCRLSPSLTASVKCLQLNGGRCITVFSTGGKLLHVVENHQICSPQHYQLDDLECYANIFVFIKPDCIPCTPCRRYSAWIEQITIVIIVNIGVSSAWSPRGMHPGLTVKQTPVCRVWQFASRSRECQHPKFGCGHAKNCQCIMNVGSSVVKFLDFVGGRDEIWVITADGKLWAIPIPLHANKQTNQHASYQARKGSPTHDIFADLLGERSSGDQGQVTPVNNVYKCSDDHVVYWEPGLQDAVIGPHHIITCSSDDSCFRLAVYPWIEGKEGKREVASSLLYQTILPRDSCNINVNKVLTMVCMAPSEQLTSKHTSITLDQQLFSSLFCSKPGVNCPIVLVGLQSGLVGYIYVGVLGCNPQNTKLETLYHLEQTVISILPVCLKSSSTKNLSASATPTCNALCILGALGKLVLITHEDTIAIREYHVPGPIVSAAISNNLGTLFYSTVKEVYTVPLQIENNEDSSYSFPLTVSPKTLHIPKVLALTIDEENFLNCLATDGRLLLVAQLSEDIIPACSQGGDEIKKHLEKIHEKASKVKNLREEIRQLDEVIKTLNTVTQVLCEILRNRDSQNEARESGIFFKVGVEYEAQGASLNPRVILRCELVNSTNFPFSPSWSLVIQVNTSEPWFNEECSVQSTVNHSVSLSHASSHHISIYLAETFSYLTPVQVSCYLAFGLNELLPIFLKDTDPALSEGGLSVFVSRTELNILNFLRKQDTCSTVSQGRSYQARLLQNTLRSMNTVGQHDLEPVDSDEFSSFSIQLSGEAADFIQAHVQELGSRNDTKFTSKPVVSNPGSKQDRSSQEACVLYYILHGSSKHVYCDDLKYQGNYITVRTPNEEVVKLQVVSQTGTTQDIKGLEVRIHTSSQELGCSLHSSLLEVFKPVLQRPSKQCKSVPVWELQKQLMKLKELQTSFDLTRYSIATEFTEDNNTHDSNIHKIISFYWELRHMPAIIY